MSMRGNKTAGGTKRKNLEGLDLDILRKLGEDPHASKASLAKLLDIPLTTLTTRIQALQSRNAIRIRPVLNVNRAGRLFVFCKLAINSENIRSELENLAKNPEFVTVTSITGGKYNAFVYFTFGDMSELNVIIRNVLMKIAGLSEMETSIISGSLLFRPEYLNYTSLAHRPTVIENAAILAKEASKCGMDELDIAIISELQTDDRKSLRAIARQYEVSPGTVRYRLQRLENEGIIRFISFVDAGDVGLNCFMILELRIDPDALGDIVQQLRDKPWLGHLHEVVGASDLIAFINARDLREAEALVSDHIRSLPGVRMVSVRIMIDTFKLDPRWGFVVEPELQLATLSSPGS
jgi:DNA-binding Lrp family transcriptional regulator